MSDELATPPKAIHFSCCLAVCGYCVRYPTECKIARCADIRTDSVNGLTCYTAGINLVVTAFDLNPDNSKTYLPIGPIAGFSVYIFGIVFAPIVTPHMVERVGRSIVYLVCLPLCGIFLLGCKSSSTTTSREETQKLILHF